MHIENLIKMANDIGNFFQADPDRSSAIRGVVEHLSKFWEPRMRRQIVAYCREDGSHLSELVKEAVKQLDRDAAPLSTSI